MLDFPAPCSQKSRRNFRLEAFVPQRFASAPEEEAIAPQAPFSTSLLSDWNSSSRPTQLHLAETNPKCDFFGEKEQLRIDSLGEKEQLND